MKEYKLSDREKTILRNVIRQFILTATPVGSRYIAKKYELGLSPATIRNIMADLEDSGYLGHPHTSAGRTPTDKGYRFYVDSLMEPPKLNTREKNIIDTTYDTDVSETDQILYITSLILSKITNQLACVTYPKFGYAILQKIQLVILSSSRLLVVLSIKSGLVKTITLEFNAEIKEKRIRKVERLLNERLSGLQLIEIRKTFKERIKDHYTDDLKPIIRMFFESADKIFNDFDTDRKSIITGAKNVLQQPEFEDQEHFQSIVELIEDKDVIVHIMDKKSNRQKGNFTISIGKENQEDKLSDYSLITKKYKVGQASGSLGVVGPKRMEYSKAVAAVIYLAELLSKELKKYRTE